MINTVNFVIQNLTCSIIQRGPNILFGNWKRSQNVIIYLLTGKLQIQSADSTLTLEAGDSVFFPEGASGSTYYVGEENIAVVFFFDIVNQAPAAKPFLIPDTSGKGSLIDSFVKKYAHGNTMDAMELYSVFYQLLYLSHSEPVVDKKFKTVHKIALDIQKNYQENRKIEDYAKAFLMSPSNMRHLFKLYTGQSIIEYRNNLRLKRAGELIALGMPIGQAVLEAGFSSLSFYYRIKRAQKSSNLE